MTLANSLNSFRNVATACSDDNCKRGSGLDLSKFIVEIPTWPQGRLDTNDGTDSRVGVQIRNYEAASIRGSLADVDLNQENSRA